MKLLISDIRVADRYRQELGDIGSLAASIKTVGLLQPIVVDPDHKLVAGQRRLEAVKSLGWDAVPATVVQSAADLNVALRAERDENIERKAMTSREMVALGQAIEEIERPKATARQGHGETAPNKPSNASGPGNLSVSDGLAAETGRVRHEVGKALGVSGPTYQRLKTIVATAEDETLPDSVRANAEKALDDIDAGKSGVRRAAEDIIQQRDHQAPAAVIETGRDQMRADSHNKRLYELRGSLKALADEAQTIDIGLAIAGRDHTELHSIASSITESLTQLRKVKSTITRGA